MRLPKEVSGVRSGETTVQGQVRRGGSRLEGPAWREAGAPLSLR